MGLDPVNLKAGHEQWEEFVSALRGNRQLIQYDYRNEDGRLFSCVADSLEECRHRRDLYVNKRKLVKTIDGAEESTTD